jgi:PPOX class probable F420-dependent enzyme
MIQPMSSETTDETPVTASESTTENPGQGSPTGMGGGVKQRSQIKMTAEEVEAFLAERRPMTLCTISHDGTIHAVAMWYGFLDGCVAIETKGKSQKALNLRRDPRATLLFEDGDHYDELRGVELVCRAEIVEDLEQLLELGKSVFSRYYQPYTDEMLPFVEVMLNKRIVAKFHVERTVSWDHRKLGLPPMRPGAQ